MSRIHSYGESSAIAISQSNARFMSRVYAWMTGGILLSAVVAHLVVSSPEVASLILGNRAIFYTLIIAEFLLVLGLSLAINHINAFVASLLYVVYCLLTGATVSVIFFIYTRSSIFSMFGLTAFAFAGLSAFGMLTKRDLGPIGSFCVMGLFGMVGYMLLSFIFPSMLSGMASQVIGLVGIVVFSGLTAYDTQKIKEMNVAGREDSDDGRKGAIYGALILYLDFINLFLSLLRVFGGRRS